MIFVPLFEKDIAEPKTGTLKQRWRQFFEALGQTYGTWYQVPHDASLYTGGGLQTWTVASADQSTLAYVLMGQLMIVAFTIVTSSVGGVADASLQIAIPAGKVAARDMSAPVWVNNNGTLAIGVARVSAGGTVIAIKLVNAANWAAAADTTGVEGQIAFEVRS